MPCLRNFFATFALVSGNRKFTVGPFRSPSLSTSKFINQNCPIRCKDDSKVGTIITHVHEDFGLELGRAKGPTRVLAMGEVDYFN